MKNSYSREDIVTFIRNVDKRAEKFTDTQIDNVINRGYAELSTVSKRIFSNEEIVDLGPYYEASELRVTFDVDEDATEIYDLYTTIEGDERDKSVCEEVIQGVGIYRNNDIIYRDNRHPGRVHIDLENVEVTFDNLLVKYYYTPRASDAAVYMDAQTYLAWQDAMWAAINYFLKDIEGEAQKRASMGRTSRAIPQEVEDTPSSARAVFSGV